MVQPSGVVLIDCGSRGELSVRLAAILKDAFTDNFFCRNVAESDSEAQRSFINSLDPARAFVVLLVTNRRLLPDARKFIQAIKSRTSNVETILASEECDANEMFDLGASDLVVPPVNAANLLPRISRLLDKIQQRKDLTQSLKAKVGMKLLVGQSPVFLAETRKIPLLASCDGRVLILGETGTGKELFARAIHYLSSRMSNPFVPVSCGAVPVELFENEMFGHVKGAFTGATTSEIGLIAEADGGTLFLDEVDCLPPLAQTKLLRFLQEGQYKPLGSSKSQYADVRIIAASNANLAEAIKEGKLRQDIYYRLNVAAIHLPPLRERRDDIPLLAEHFLTKYTHQFERDVRKFSEAALQKLTFYNWPGNIRELENTIERAVMLSESECIDETDILVADSDFIRDGESFRESKARMIVQFERTYIQQLMATHHGNVTQAARAAKKNRRAFSELIRKYNIDVQNFRANKASG